MALETHNYRLLNSKEHRGQLITRVPLSYLKWMVNVGHSESDYARAELERRGTVKPEFEVSGHAIDRASMTCMSIYRKTRNEGEGLHAWLCRVGAQALKVTEKKSGKRPYLGMLFAFTKEAETDWPVLKTVMIDDHNRKLQHTGGGRHEAELVDDNTADHPISGKSSGDQRARLTYGE